MGCNCRKNRQTNTSAQTSQPSTKGRYELILPNGQVERYTTNVQARAAQIVKGGTIRTA